MRFEEKKQVENYFSNFECFLLLEYFIFLKAYMENIFNIQLEINKRKAHFIECNFHFFKENNRSRCIQTANISFQLYHGMMQVCYNLILGMLSGQC